MFKKGKKSIAIVLAVILSLSLFSSVSFAEREAGFAYEIKNGEATIIDFDFFYTEITIPLTLGGAPVTSVQLSIFQNFSKLQAIYVAPDHPYFCSVDGVLFSKDMTTLILYPKARTGVYTVPDGVQKIGNCAFYKCIGLTEVKLPDSITSIEDEAFTNCDNLSAINLPDGITSIGSDAFCACIGLAEIHIPAGLTFIDYFAFASCSALKEVSIPEGVTAIGYYAFAYCTALTKVTLPSSIKEIMQSSFEGCDALQKVLYLGSRGEWCKVKDSASSLPEKITYLDSGFKPSTVDVSRQFTDIQKGTWYYNAVNFTYNNEIFLGTSKTTFEPNSPMTRAMFVTVLGRLLGVQKSEKHAVKFKDVPTGKWYTGYVAWAEEAGISDGIAPDAFGPELLVTREQICKMMTRYCFRAGIMLPNKNKVVTFKDTDQISDWARDSVRTCQTAGLVNGSDGKFNPQSNASRAEVAQILMNFANNYLK